MSPDAPPRTALPPEATGPPGAAGTSGEAASPTNALAAGAAHLDAWLALTFDTARAHLDATQTGLQKVAASLATHVGGLADAHRALMAALPADTDGALPDRATLWEALTSHRAAVEAEVLVPLQHVLSESDLPGQVTEAATAPFRALRNFADDAPGRVARPEPADLLVPTPDDPAGVRLRKATERRRRALAAQRRALGNRLRRLVRREPRPAPVPAQTVFVQALLDYHAQVRLGGLFEALHEATQQTLAQTLADVTLALDGWLQTALRAEAALDRAALHDIDALVWPDEALPRILDDAPEEHVPSGAPPPLSENETALVRAALDGALVLQRALDGATSPLPPGLFADARATLDAAHAVLADDVDRSARLRLRPTRILPAATERPDARVAGRAGAWAAWHPALHARLALMRHLFGLRTLLLTELDGLVARIGQGGLLPLLGAVQRVVDRLLDLSRAAADACADAAATDDVAGLTTALRSLLEDARRQTEGQLLRHLQTSSLSTALEHGLAAAGERIATSVEALPEALLVASDLDARPLDPTAKPERALVRPSVQAALDQSFLARLGEGGETLKQPLFRVLARAEEVQSAVHYNLDAALEELGATLPDATHTPEVESDAVEDADVQLLSAAPEVSSVSTPEDEKSQADPDLPEGETPRPAGDAGSDAETQATDTDDGDTVSDAERIASARELTVTGLARSAERLGGIVAPLHEPWAAFLKQATQVFERRWGMLHQRLEAASVERQFLDVRLRVADESARMGREAQDRLATLWARSVRLYRKMQARARLLIRKGQNVAGLTQSVAAAQQTLDELAAVETLRQQLPLVYRRLFSFEPIADPLLLVGRDVQLQTLSGIVERWRAQQPSSAVVVTAATGGGATSFLRVAAGTMLCGLTVHRVELTDRLTDPDALAEALVRAFEIELPEAPGTRLARLERALLAEPGPPQRVCLLERMEHLMLRTSGGLVPLEAVLTFLSRTDHRVCWITTMKESAWRFVARTAPAVTGLVTPLPLPPLERDALEALVLKRHTRSGLPLVFQEPAAPAPLLVRRLKGAKTDAARQDLLRADYFDRLARASGRHVALALFYWLRSLDFEAAADRLTVRSLPPLDFGFLAGYDLPRAFALKALLQHGTLTLGEYQRVFRATPRESYLLFEALANELLIAHANGTEGLHPMAIKGGERYRLHPLLVHPVAEALRARNML